MTETPRKRSIYELAGGEATFFALVDNFYQGVEQDPILRPMYPAEDFEGARHRLALFLIQYFGGPTTYSDERGHPRLRMRHMPFAIDQAARDAWMGNMKRAIEATDIDSNVKPFMLDYFENAATFMINRG